MGSRSNFPTAQAIVLFGPQGVGKTSLGCQFPDPWVLHDPRELGVYTLQKYHQIEDLKIAPKEFTSFPEFMESISEPPEEMRTLVVDGLFGLEQVLVEWKVDEDYGSEFDKFNDYKKGYDNLAKNEVNEIIKGLRSLLDQDINVVLLSQVSLNKVENPYGADYRQYGPNLDARIWEPFKTWADAVLFYHMEVATKRDASDKRKKEGKIASFNRAVHTQFNAHHEAKNRIGLPEVIEGESVQEIYKNYRDAVIAAYKGTPNE